MAMQVVLIPTFIGVQEKGNLPQRTLDKIYSIRHFIVERERTARAFLKAIQHPLAQQDFVIHELDKHGNYNNFHGFVDQHLSTDDIGVLSEAGLPAIADPGSSIIAYAHSKSAKIVPLAGTSSIFLALMASGLNGQDFRFHGYLPIDSSQRLKKLKEMEKFSGKSTQIFMEAPYRNNDFLSFLIKNLQKSTTLCIACDLESEREIIISKKVSEWSAKEIDLHKRPCIYLIGQ
ncbi:MAG: SAM-dependent methyltransferase [Bacteroidia bacterium]